MNSNEHEPVQKHFGAFSISKLPCCMLTSAEVSKALCLASWSSESLNKATRERPKKKKKKKVRGKLNRDWILDEMEIIIIDFISGSDGLGVVF